MSFVKLLIRIFGLKNVHDSYGAKEILYMYGTQEI
jgi:hypothetical protein